MTMFMKGRAKRKEQVEGKHYRMNGSRMERATSEVQVKKIRNIKEQEDGKERL